MHQVEGYCAPAFAEVRAEFERNFEAREEVGAGVSVWFEGKQVVDLWGGLADLETGRAWSADTMTVVFSSTKGLAAICMHLLIDRGLLEVDAPVARYWPEFAANGKAAITVGMVLSHQAGLPFWRDKMPAGGLLDWDCATQALAAQAPVWEPGTCHGYHGMTIGFLEGELLRRVTGMTIGEFLRREVAEPLGADVWIGLPPGDEGRVARVYLKSDWDPNSDMYRKLTAEPNWYGWQMVGNDGGYVSDESINARKTHAAQAPAIGGIASARGLARAYAPLSLDGAIDGVRLVRETALPGMRTVRSASSCDLLLRLPTTFTLGFSKTWGARALGAGNHVVMGEQAFGTPGMGGSLGFADGEAKLAFGYVMNRHGGGVGLNERGQSLVDAAYRACGYSSSTPGFWVR